MTSLVTPGSRPDDYTARSITSIARRRPLEEPSTFRQLCDASHPAVHLPKRRFVP